MENKCKKTKYFSVADVAKLLGVSRIAVFNKIKKGQIPAQKIGRAYVISVEDAFEFANGARNILTEENKKNIKEAVGRVVREYGQTLKLLGKE